MEVSSPRSHNVFLFSLLLTALTICLSRSQSVELECPDGWKNCYLLNTTLKLSWSEAQESCRKRDGSLVDIKSSDENEIVQKLLKKSSSKGSWIGLSKNKSNPVRSINSSKDNIGYRQACFVITADGIQQERPCRYTFSSICVSRGSSDCRPRWEKVEQYCYLGIFHKMAWPGAHANCFEKNAELMTYSNVTLFKKVFTHLFKKGPPRIIWNGFKIRLAYENPTQGWKWINGTKFNGFENGIVLVNDPVYGWNCATFYQGKVNLWQNCLTKHSFICKRHAKIGNDSNTCSMQWINNGSYCYLFAQNELPWNDASENCTAQGGDLLSFFNSSDETAFILGHLKKVHYWLGLNRNRENRSICGLIEGNHSMNIFHYQWSHCSVTKLSSDNKPYFEEQLCNDKHHSICIGYKINSTDCQGGWINIGSRCFLVVQNISMRWDLSQEYCLEKNATLAPSFLLNNSIANLSLSRNKDYWIETKVFNAPNNPTKGWVWTDGRNLTTNDGLGSGRLPYTGYEKRCAGTKTNGEWFGDACSKRLFFVCKTKVTPKKAKTKSQIVDQLNKLSDVSNKTLKECQEILNTTVKLVSEIFDDNESNKNESINAEEVITASANIVNAILQKGNFNTSMKISTDKIELDIFIKGLEELKGLKNGTAEVQYLSLSSVKRSCRNPSTCVVKRAIVKINNISLNASALLKDKNKSAFEVADVISIDFYADKIKIVNLQESISIEFQRKDNRKLGNPNCVYLESGGWSKNGMETGESNGNTVNCITDHFSSFAMVVIAAEVDGDHKKAFAYISYIGSGLSLIGLSITLLCYVVLHKDLQVLNSTRHLVHLNLQLSLGLIQIIFLAGAGKTDDKVVCKIVAILLHYFSLASFCWILLEGTMLYLKVISVFRGTVVGIKSFYVFGWGFPLFFVSIAVLVERDAYGTDKWCWLSYDYGYFWVFFAPVILVTTLNLAVLIAVMKVLFRVSKKSCNTKANILNTLRGLIILFPALGMSWVFSIISVNHDAVVWKYCFAIFNSLQGFLVFFIYGVCNQEIRLSLKRRLGRGINPSSTSGQVQATPVESKM